MAKVFHGTISSMVLTSNYDGAYEMVHGLVGNEVLIGIQRDILGASYDLPRSNFEADLSWS